jgi:exosortase J
MAEPVDIVSPIPGEMQLESKFVRTTTSIALWWGIALLTAAGCLGVHREMHVLWTVWTTDPLRSIGMLIPPASIVLTLRVWRQHGWELRGTWWGILVIALAYILSWLRLNAMLMVVAGRAMVSFLPICLPLYVYGGGIVLLFGGTTIWRRSWFPLGILLLSQPVPFFFGGLVDIPLQNISASVARHFATMIGLIPTTPQLRLMFSPDFGMFIAPGCDGIRGAVTMGYFALILGYLKRVSIYRWAAYICGAVLLGYLFNFIRLCVLVLYYRAALGHSMPEGLAKQADYLIGSCLFLAATLLFLWLARRQQQNLVSTRIPVDLAGRARRNRSTSIKCAALAALLLAALSLPSSALRYPQNASPTPESLAARMPTQVSSFALTHTWYEQENDMIVIESGAYAAPGSDEITLGVWVAPFLYFHDTQQCWMARGLNPDMLARKEFTVAGGQSVLLNTGFYDDGVTESIVINGICTPSSCTQFQRVGKENQFGFLFLKPHSDYLSATGSHPVPIMLRIERLHSNIAKTVTYSQLSGEARLFLAGLDMKGLSRDFQ